MTDSHCHLDRCDDPAAAVDQSLAAIVTVGTDAERSRAAVAAAERHPNVYAAVGVHPNDASLAADPAVRAAVAELARHPLVVAIGETGFDRYWEDETPASQLAAFEWQLELARDVDKPLVLHVRDKQGQEGAALAAAAALRAGGYGKGMLHCFGGHTGLLEVGLELGWMVSFAGNLTYKSAADLRSLAARVPLDRLLVETDSPYLAPVPHRGKPNVPANVRHTAALLAQVVEATPTELEAVLDANAERFFGFAAARAAAA
ncbi:MAG: TatD family hydrolase [Trueperaceae bacterium]|nr:TatD family hydrolase [Trueperaceae bacterium]